MKVGYKTLRGGTSTAYLDDEPVAKNTYLGMNKHTDEDIKVMSIFDEDGEFVEWIEIANGVKG